MFHSYQAVYSTYILAGLVLALIIIALILVYFRYRAKESERARIIATIDESPDFIGMADMDGHLLYHNTGAKKMVGLPVDFDMTKLKVEDMHPRWAFQRLSEHVLPIVLKEGTWHGETVLRHHQSGAEIPVLQTLTVHRDKKNKPIFLTTIMRDISDLKNSQKSLKNSEETFRLAMENAPIGMAIVSLEGRWLKVNPALCHLVGYSEEELLTMDFQTLTPPEDLEIDIFYLNQFMAGTIQTHQMEKRYIKKDGSLVWILLNVSLQRDILGNPISFIAQILDIDSQKKAEEELKYIAYHDSLTGLANRKQLEKSFDLASSYAQRYQKQIAVLFLDLDGFKKINDRYGHEIGDLLLVEIANRLLATVRNTDFIVRLGGDEFIVVLTELTEIEQVKELAEKILMNIAKPIKAKKLVLQVTVSIGISLYPEHSQELKDLIRYADDALYNVKLEGRNHFKLFFNPDKLSPK